MWWQENPLACHRQQGATTCWQHSHHSRTDTKTKYDISTHIYSNQYYIMIKSKSEKGKLYPRTGHEGPEGE